MSLEAITLLIEPPRVDLSARFPPGPATVTERQFYRYDRFAAEMQKHTSAPVVVVEDFLRNAPDQGMILVEWAGDATVDELPDDRCQGILGRVVLLQVDAQFILADLEKLRCAGAIAIRHYMEWAMKPDAALGTGLYGLRSIAPEIGASCEDYAGSISDHYCYFTSDRFDRLPSIVVGYLELLRAVVRRAVWHDEEHGCMRDVRWERADRLPGLQRDRRRRPRLLHRVRVDHQSRGELVPSGKVRCGACRGTGQQ